LESEIQKLKSDIKKILEDRKKIGDNMVSIKKEISIQPVRT